MARCPVSSCILQGANQVACQHTLSMPAGATQIAPHNAGGHTVLQVQRAAQRHHPLPHPQACRAPCGPAESSRCGFSQGPKHLMGWALPTQRPRFCRARHSFQLPAPLAHQIQLSSATHLAWRWATASQTQLAARPGLKQCRKRQACLQRCVRPAGAICITRHALAGDAPTVKSPRQRIHSRNGPAALAQQRLATSNGAAALKCHAPPTPASPAA